MSEKEIEKNLWRFFANPIVGVLGSLASIVGLVLAVYFYLASSRNRELAYMVYPAKTVVVKAGQTSRLSVTFEGKKLERDVTAAQFAFWNNGKEPIRDSHVLSPFVVKVDDARIIEARVRKKSREIVDLSLNTSRLGMGEVEVAWNILEQNDGGVIQIVYAGNPESLISASAIIEGQPRIDKVDSPEPKARPEPSPLLWRVMAGSLIVFGLFGFLLARRWAGSRYLYVTRHSNGFSLATVAPLLVVLVMPLILIAVSLLGLFYYGIRDGPPFGF